MRCTTAGCPCCWLHCIAADIALTGTPLGKLTPRPCLQALFGFDDVTDDSDEDEEGPAKKRRTKNALAEPLFCTDVTGAPNTAADVGTSQGDGAPPPVKQEEETEKVEKAQGPGPEDGKTKGPGTKDGTTQEAEAATPVEVKVENGGSSEEGNPKEAPALDEDVRRGQARPSKYRPELEDVVYDVSSCLIIDVLKLGFGCSSMGISADYAGDMS